MSLKIFKFCEAHTELEHLSVKCETFISDVPNDAVCKLPKLKSFSCERGAMSKGNVLSVIVEQTIELIDYLFSGFVDAITESYPNLEVLELTTYRNKTSPPDDRALSAITFSKLTKLSLRGFQLQDGAALLEVKSCFLLSFYHRSSLIAFHFLNFRLSMSAPNWKFCTC